MFLGFLFGFTSSFSNFVLICSNPLPSIRDVPKRGGGSGMSMVFVSIRDKDEPIGEEIGAITFLLKSVASRTIMYLLYSKQINDFNK